MAKSESKNGMSKHDWRDALKVLTDEQLRTALLRQRDGTPAEPGDPLTGMPGKPRRVGAAEELAEMVSRRWLPGFEGNNTPEQVEVFDAQMAFLTDVLGDIEERLENAEKLRRTYQKEPAKEG
jgi:hypothetical protein